MSHQVKQRHAENGRGKWEALCDPLSTLEYYPWKTSDIDANLYPSQKPFNNLMTWGPTPYPCSFSIVLSQSKAQELFRHREIF